MSKLYSRHCRTGGGRELDQYDGSEVKAYRLLEMFGRLNHGETLRKKDETVRYGVTNKTIQRDIEDMRAYLAMKHPEEAESRIEYDKSKGGYVLSRDETVWLTQEEVLWLARILLESRSLPATEMYKLLDKLSVQCSPDERKRITEIVRNEAHHYMPLRHGRNLLSILWDFSKASREQRMVDLRYRRESREHATVRRVLPQAVLFSEYYFYLLAFTSDRTFDFPTIYRLDRVQDYTVTDEHFRVDYVNRFEEGEFRKRIQFMQSGRLMTVTFRFWGESLDAILDRLPTAEIVKRDERGTVLKAETFGRGIKMWFLSQAQYLEVIEPAEFRDEMMQSIRAMMHLYD